MNKEQLEIENKYLRELVQDLTNKLNAIEAYLDTYYTKK